MFKLSNYSLNQKIQVEDKNCSYKRIQSRWNSSQAIIKTVDSAHSYQWLHNEYNLLQQKEISGVLDPKHLVKVRDRWVLVLEDFAGVFLSDFLRHNKTNVQDFLKIAIRLSSACHRLHRQKIVHQNLNTSSILIDEETLDVRITNLNIATKIGHIGRNQSENFRTINPAYISPEQTGKTNYLVDYRTDLYSLGIIFYQLLTEKLPYQALEPLELIHYHLACNPYIPKSIADSLEPPLIAIVMKLLEKNPSNRYQSAWGLMRDLEHCQAEYQQQKQIHNFELGRLDKRSNFVISYRQYGFEEAKNTLTDCLERVYSGAVELVVVRGEFGSGKTSLVQKVVQQKIQHKGFFIRGAFEETETKNPYSGIRKAFNNLVQQLLTLDEESIQQWRERILATLGDRAGAIIDVLPELELIIPSYPQIAKLPAKETENRLNILFAEFVKLFASEQNPLSIFLDDLQWADSASLNLLSSLLERADYQYLLVILADCQDSNLDSDSNSNSVFSDCINFNYLLNRLSETTKNQLTTTEIAIPSLRITEVANLLSDTFECSETEQLLELATLLWKRTQGNPLFIRQLLQILYDENAIWFDFQDLTWKWDLSEIAATPINNSGLLSLFIKHLNKLDETTQKVLEKAVCIGSKFDLPTLVSICQYGKIKKQDVTESLDKALQAGIIFIVREQPAIQYSFFNCRLQQAIYARLPESIKLDRHYAIGEYLLTTTPPEDIESKIFNIVYHLNIARKKVAGEAMKRKVARLNLLAARKAKAAVAYEVAANHLEIALGFLPNSTWKDDYQLIFDTYLEAIELQYLQTQFAAAEYLAKIALNFARNICDRVQIYEQIVRSQIARNQMDLALSTCLLVLSLLDADLPNDEQQKILEQVYFNVDETFISKLEHLPHLTDKQLLAQMKILTASVPPAYIVRPQILPKIVFKAVELSVQYGNSEYSAFAFALYGLLLCNRGEIEKGYKMGQLALRLTKKFVAPESNPKVSFIFNTMIRHWREPNHHTINCLREGIDCGIEVGDVEHACFSAKYYCTYLFFTGEPLTKAQEKAQQQINVIRCFQQTFQLNYASIWQQLNLNLQGLVENPLLLVGDSLNETEIIDSWEQEGNATLLFAFYLAKLILCYNLKEYQLAVEYARKAKQYINAAIGTICFSMYYFYLPLVILARYKQDKDKLLIAVKIAKGYRKKLRTWSKLAPENHLNKYYLLSAEIYRAIGKNNQAAEYYDRAIDSAAQLGYLAEIALAQELAGEFYLSQKRNKIASYYLSDAYDTYNKWQASAKLAILKDRYSSLIKTPSSEKLEIEITDSAVSATAEHSLSTIDFMSMMKASQAISSEIVLDNLFSKMMRIVTENAGAQRSVLLLKQNSSWEIVASASSSPRIEIDTTVIPIEEYRELPLSIVNYIKTTRKTVILPIATQDDLFCEDPYIAGANVQSILACPIIYKDSIQGIIYLENNLFVNAFSNAKSETLQILLSQFSISIENARLYQNLEEHTFVKKSLQQKEILLKEIHHRVKNNLFVASSLLDFQSNYVDNLEVIKILQNSQNRIMSMALIHEHLYGSKDLNKINVAEYVESLLDKLAYSQSSAEKNINLIRDLEPIEINIETANPCGLIVNELVSNALEHGFENRNTGNIWLVLKQDLKGKVTLIVRDDGAGFKEGSNLQNSDSLGLELVCTLVEQLDGEISLDCTEGTTIELTFTELNYESRI